jgi:proteasome lid subunit RPN8/RPN11
MIDFDEVSYAAIITITLPAAGKSTSVAVTLAPQDRIATAGGRIKRLRDCTLADLQEFADALEEDVWQTYQDIKLVDLPAEAEAGVKVTILNESGERLAHDESWLDHGLVLVEAPAGDGESDPPTEEALAEELPAETEGEAPAGEAGAAEEEPAEATAAMEEEEPAVAVAEPQQVIQEREAGAVVAPAKPDIRIAGKRRPLAHTTQAAVDILINEPAFRDAQAHSLTSLDREVAGVLIGPPPEKQPDGRYVVHVSDTIIAKYTKMHGASVTYTPESWRYVNDRLAEMYPDESAVIVGWYHTHPGFGIFLSGMDQFIHQNFFIQIWHIALVLDPVARRSGFFCWDRRKSRVDPYDFPWPDWAAGSW